MAKTLLAITTAGQLRWLKEAIATLRDPLDVLVIDDATPGSSIRDFCKQKGIEFITKGKPLGLTDSWNTAYSYFRKNGYDYLRKNGYENCIISNDDVMFPARFSEGILKALKEYDLVAPLSNNAGFQWDNVHSPLCQDIGRFVGIKSNDKNVDKVQEIISERYKKTPFRRTNFINGFCFAFCSSISKYAFNEHYLFNPANINTFNEYDLANRINKKDGKIAICKTSYVFHWKAKTTEKLNKNWGQSGDYREQLWR